MTKKSEVNTEYDLTREFIARVSDCAGCIVEDVLSRLLELGVHYADYEQRREKLKELE